LRRQKSVFYNTDKGGMEMSFYSAGMDIWNHILSYILGK